jgi:septum formation inhibitor-activating ATPase MinD
MRVISILSTRGSVGKTTITANVDGILADTGLRVLLSLPPIFTRAAALLHGASEDWRERHV